MILFLNLQALQIVWTCGLQSLFISGQLWLSYNEGEGKNVISIHNTKDILVISGLVAFFLYALKKELQKNFDKNMLHVYRYSIPFFLGIFITFISVLGFVYSFYYAVKYAIWLFISACMGYTLVIYSNGILAKYQNNERRYKEIMNTTKNIVKYIIIVLFALILKEWFI